MLALLQQYDEKLIKLYDQLEHESINSYELKKSVGNLHADLPGALKVFQR